MLTHYLTKKSEIIQRLKDAGWPESNPQQIADWLLQEVLGVPFLAAAIAKQQWTHKHQQRLEQLLYALLIERKPLGYVLGTVPFCSLSIKVKQPVLIPRPETEGWVLDLIAQLRLIDRPLRILDLCTGSGCIALALAHALTKSIVIGIDSSPQALALAQLNKKSLDLSNVSFMQSDLFMAVHGQRFDVIVANPPYVAHDEWHNLEPIVRDWEDRHALVAAQHGLALLYAIIEQAPRYITQSDLTIPHLVLEIGSTQAQAVCAKFNAYGYTEVNVGRDLAGFERVVTARYQKGSICKKVNPET